MLKILFSPRLLAAETDAPGGGGPEGKAPGGKAPEGKPAKPKSKKVKVRVTCASLGEESEYYKKGDTFETTEERAQALGDLVEVI